MISFWFLMSPFPSLFPFSEVRQELSMHKAEIFINDVSVLTKSFRLCLIYSVIRFMRSMAAHSWAFCILNLWGDIYLGCSVWFIFTEKAVSLFGFFFISFRSGKKKDSVTLQFTVFCEIWQINMSCYSSYIPYCTGLIFFNFPEICVDYSAKFVAGLTSYSQSPHS